MLCLFTTWFLTIFLFKEMSLTWLLLVCTEDWFFHLLPLLKKMSADIILLTWSNTSEDVMNNKLNKNVPVWFIYLILMYCTIPLALFMLTGCVLTLCLWVSWGILLYRMSVCWSVLFISSHSWDYSFSVSRGQKCTAGGKSL